jgi:hypothetical protein
LSIGKKANQNKKLRRNELNNIQKQNILLFSPIKIKTQKSDSKLDISSEILSEENTISNNYSSINSDNNINNYNNISTEIPQYKVRINFFIYQIN